MNNSYLTLILLFLPFLAHSQSQGSIVESTNDFLPKSYQFKEYVFAEPQDQGDCTGITNESAVIQEVFFSQNHRHSPAHPFFFIIGHRPVLMQVALSGNGSVPDVQVEGFHNGTSIGTLCLSSPSTLTENLDLSVPNFEDYYSVTLPMAWVRQELSLKLTSGSAERVLSSEELKVGPYTELNLVEVKMDVMDYNVSEHNTPIFESFLQELASAIPVSVIRYGVFPEPLVYPEVIANNDTEQLARLKSKGELAANGIFNEGSINSITTLSLSNLHHSTGDFLSTVYFGNTLNLAPGGWGGGNSFVSPDFTDIFIHELGHALSLPHWGEGPYANNDANMFEFNYPYGSSESSGGGRGQAWTFNQDLYEFVDPICQYDARGEAGIEASDCMQRNNHCLEKRSNGPGPWDGFGDFSAYAMHRYFVGDAQAKSGTVNYKGEEVPYQFRFAQGFPVGKLVDGSRIYERALPMQEDNKHWQEVVDLPGQERLNEDVYLVYGTVHETQDQATIVYKPIEFNGTLPPVIDPTDPETFEALKHPNFERLGEKDITLKVTYEDGSVLHLLNIYNSIDRLPYDWTYNIWRNDVCNFSMVVPADKPMQKVEIFIRPFISAGIGSPHLGNINDPAQGISASNFMDEAKWRGEFVFGQAKVPGQNTIGNRVWNDLNQNGLDDFDEPGIPGVKLIMWEDSDGDGIPDSEGFAGFAETDEEGKYSFSPGIPGNYLVFVWSVDNWEEGGALHGMTGVPGHVDPNTDINGDDNGRPGGWPGLSELDIASGVIVITADGEPLNDGDPIDDWFDLDASGNQTIDFGFYFENSCATLNVEVTQSAELCTDQETTNIVLMAAEGQGPFSYMWEDGSTGNTLPSVSSGIYKVTFTDEAGCIGSEEISVEINLPPDVDISGPDSLCAGAVSTLDLLIEGENGPFVIVGLPDEVTIGSYEIHVEDILGCSTVVNWEISESDETSCTSATTESSIANVEIMPNPFTSRLKVLSSESKIMYLELRDLLGRLVHKVDIHPGENEVLWDQEASGVYLAILRNMEGDLLGYEKLVKVD